ncbi:MAG TPA: hypothetical protein VGF86_13115 [Candidatus Tumulicola sp.]|jgi:hypothetical protein
MKTILATCTGLALLAGCMGGNASTFAPTAAARTQSAAQAAGAGSSKQAYLYVSDFNDSVVRVYTYPQLRLAQTLTGLLGPQGMCADASGNVWVATGSHELVEYAPDGSEPIGTLEDPNQNPLNCSVNRRNGDLAVANVFGSNSEGGLAIYKHARGKPTLYPNGEGYFVGYDDAGNAFLDGLDSFGLVLDELPKGASKLVSLNVRGLPSGAFPGDVQWDGDHLAVGNQSTPNGSVIYQMKVRGNAATVIGTTTLENSSDVADFLIFGTGAHSRVLGSDVSGSMGIYRYPAGGLPKKILGIPGGNFTITFPNNTP